VGDLDLRFTPAPTAQQGIVGHAEVFARRGTGYQREVSLSTEYRELRIVGRADGWDPAKGQLEEIKTHRGDLARQPANHRALHWAQAKTYAHLMCERESLASVWVALVYFDIGSKKESVIREQFDALSLKREFEALAERFLAWAQAELRHRTLRNDSIATMQFPHEAFRASQRTLAEAVYRANCSGRYLLAQAPTGIGKTIGTLFPLLKAAPSNNIDKVFYLTAKTTGRQLALDVLRKLQAPANQAQRPLRVLELQARDKACVHPDKACHGEACPLARGFYDRLPAARAQAAAVTWLDKDTVGEVAQTHAVCPYYLAQDMVRWSDVVIGDYNHYFDLSALLHGLMIQEDWRVSLLLDEAHNLVDRARSMFTAQLDYETLRGQRMRAPAALHKSLDAFKRQWNALIKPHEKDYEVIGDPSEKFLLALQKCITQISDVMAEDAAHIEADLQSFYFDLLQFQRVAELFGDHSIFDLTRTGHKSNTLCLRNVLPGPLLKIRWREAHSATAFSATLQPQDYFISMLGLPQDTVCLDVPSPFGPQQLQVLLTRNISTRYRDREASLPTVVQVIGRQFEKQPGNYLAFFSSYDYLQSASLALAQRFPSITQWSQSRSMSETDRQRFIERFQEQGQGVGFAVLGGAFGEGIDLPGSRLIGAFIATLGMPQINPVNEQMRVRLETLLGAGFDYTYTYPGLQKVIQAVGRVIRTETDRGVVYLMDDRYLRPQTRDLLPKWWRLQDFNSERRE
jgi:DNA excision repair protein ERCC-2